ncbi:MAG: GntR family transcriptional regulator [Eubacterium sp.]
MSKLILIDYHSRVPIYEQIKEQIIMLINMEVYKPGDQLPSIRVLAKELNLNVNTVKRAFTELENDGVTRSLQGRGVFVNSNPLGNEHIKQTALEDIKLTVQSAKAKGVSEQDVINLVDSVYKEGDTDD